jgi:hypothetical protein
MFQQFSDHHVYAYLLHEIQGWGGHKIFLKYRSSQIFTILKFAIPN